MGLEICCQCEGTTGRAGRGEDSLYTDNDWGPYCEDCWGDADYWRCLTDEKVTEIERLKQALADAHGLLISYGKTADHFEDLKHDVELHFSAFRQDAGRSLECVCGVEQAGWVTHNVGCPAASPIAPGETDDQ